MAIPPVVEQLLRNNKLLHLATSSNDQPSVSLMNFSYVEPDGASPATIILSSSPDTTKIENIKFNPNVALLIHDWTHDHSPESETISLSKASNLSQYLARLNQSQLSQTSATLYGHARIPSGEEAEYYRAKHLGCNPEAECFIKNADVVLVVPHKVRIADFHNNVKTYQL